MRRHTAVTILLLLTIIGIAFAQQSGPIGQLRGRTDATGGLVTSGGETDTAYLATIASATSGMQTDLATWNTLDSYIAVGTSEDEHQVKATAGVLRGISAYNNHASADAFLKCSNLTAANTTPGSSAVFYRMKIPFGGGYVDSDIDATFSVALTCYVVLGEADTDVAEVAANDVGYNLRYR
jgi:hypothetical protein